MIAQFRALVEQEKGKHKAIEASLKVKQKEVTALKREVRNVEDAIPIIQMVAKDTQEELKFHISELVTLALSAVFEEPYEFVIEFVTRRGKTEADLLFKRNGHTISPMDASGFGAVDIASLALRIAMWNLKRPRSTNTMALDEPFHFLSSDLQEKAGIMLKNLSDKLGIQFIIISHIESLPLAADKVFKVTNKKGISKVL